MTTSSNDRGPTFGYLLVDEDERHGFTGGLLVVCERGRPLEFHCTEPVQPTHAQQILFGPTLREYVCGEQIGGALLDKVKLPLSKLLVCDDDTAHAGRRASVPTICLEGEEAAANTDPSVRRLAEVIDLSEPFTRVREAIREAQRLGVGGPTRAVA